MRDQYIHPQDGWKEAHPELYLESVKFQELLRKAGIAWHNPLANECVVNRACCTNQDHPEIRINRHGEFRTSREKNESDFIAKKDLVHGANYLNANRGRGMKVGLWDSHKQRFICIKPPEFGQYSIYEMLHFEDDWKSGGTVIFEPIERIS